MKNYIIGAILILTGCHVNNHEHHDQGIEFINNHKPIVVISTGSCMDNYVLFKDKNGIYYEIVLQSSEHLKIGDTLK